LWRELHCTYFFAISALIVHSCYNDQIMHYILASTHVHSHTHAHTFFDGYCSTVQGLLDWFVCASAHVCSPSVCECTCVLAHTLSSSLSMSLSRSRSRCLALFLPLSRFHLRALSRSLCLSRSICLPCTPSPTRSLSFAPCLRLSRSFFISFSLSLFSSLSRIHACYGVAMIIRLLKIISLFCRIQSLLQGSFAKETYNFKAPTHRSHPISCSLCLPPCSCAFSILFFPFLFPFPSHIEYAIVFWLWGLHLCRRALQSTYRRYLIEEFVVFPMRLPRQKNKFLCAH